MSCLDDLNDFYAFYDFPLTAHCLPFYVFDLKN
jgi:hypothetical protein